MKWWEIYILARRMGLSVTVELAAWDDPVC